MRRASVDLAAPGVDIYSTDLTRQVNGVTTQYRYLSGTSQVRL